MLVMVLGRLIEVRPVQLLNAEDPMLVTELGIVIDVRLVQLYNALSAMLVMVLGRLMDVRPVQLENAEDPIPVTEYEKPAVVVTLLGIVISPAGTPPLLATSTVVGLVTKYLMPLMVNSLPKSFHTNAAV
jgi:hypothetical protein